MDTDGPSRTAMAVARARADHQSADEPRIFTDPYARVIVGEDDQANGEFDRGLDPGLVRRRRLFIAARSRLADDTVAAAVADGTRQVVVLGAGLDTSALRRVGADNGVRFFEVDHPSTQRWKRRRLAEAGIGIPATLTFLPLDFETSTLGDGLADAGFDRGQAAVFVWLGVVAYLTRPSITSTCRYVGGSRALLVMDYMYPPTDSTRERAARVAASGEPWLSWFTPDEIGAELSAAGLTVIEDLPASALLSRYLDENLPPDTGAILTARATA